LLHGINVNEQHFSAGILLSAVAIELLPALKGQSLVATFVGFMLGMYSNAAARG